VTEGQYSRVGYMHKGGARDSLSMTAIGVMCRIFMDKNKADPRLSNGCDLLLREKPKWSQRSSTSTTGITGAWRCSSSTGRAARSGARGTTT